MREFIKVKLNIIDLSSYQKSIEKYHSFLFSLELPMQLKNTFEARIKGEQEKELLLEIDGKYQLGTEIPFSELNTGSKIYILNAINRKALTHCAEAIVIERYFEEAKKESRVAEKIIPLTSYNSTVVKKEFSFSKKEFDWIKLGRTPKSMDIKWHIYFENNTLHFLRAWSSKEVFKVKFKEENGSFFSTEVQVDTEMEHYNEIELLESLLRYMAEAGKKVFN